MRWANSDDILARRWAAWTQSSLTCPPQLNMIATQVDNGVVVGQFADAQDGENYGIVLPGGSLKLTPTVFRSC